MDVGEPGQADRLHLGRRVQLHGARARAGSCRGRARSPGRRGGAGSAAWPSRSGAPRRRGGSGSGPGAGAPRAGAAAALAPPTGSAPRRPRARRRRGPPSSSRRTRSRRGRRRRGGGGRHARARVGDDRRRPAAVPRRPRCRRTPGGRGRSRPARSPAASSSGPAVDAAGDAAQALGAVVHGVHGGDHGQQHLGRADVRGRLLPADVLLARLQRQPVGRPVLRVDREPDEASGQVALESGLDRHEGRVRPAVPERHAEALGGPDDDVGAPLPRRLQQRQRQQVGGHGHQRAPGVGLARSGPRSRGWRPSTPGTAAPRRSSRRRAARRPGRPRRARSRAAPAASPARRWSGAGSRRRR